MNYLRVSIATAVVVTLVNVLSSVAEAARRPNLLRAEPDPRQSQKSTGKHEFNLYFPKSFQKIKLLLHQQLTNLSFFFDDDIPRYNVTWELRTIYSNTLLLCSEIFWLNFLAFVEKNI
jgi:hypothetical protein